MNRNDFRSAYDKIVLPEDVRAEMKKSSWNRCPKGTALPAVRKTAAPVRQGRFGFSRESAVPDVLWRSQAPLRRW